MTGDMFSPDVVDAATDLAADGYYTLVCAYRMAPCGLIKGQVCHSDSSSGRPPEQTDDVKAFVRAARADSHCLNEKVGIVGGSSGASHAAFAALDITSSTGWPNWTASDRPNAVACLSGAYDFSDRTPESYLPDPLPNFIFLIENYTNSCDPSVQKPYSPVAQVTEPSDENPFRPMYIICSDNDTMPFHQIIDMQCALESKDIDTSLYEIHVIPDSTYHAFAYWRVWDGVSGSIVHDWGYHVIVFLDQYLK